MHLNCSYSLSKELNVIATIVTSVKLLSSIVVNEVCQRLMMRMPRTQLMLRWRRSGSIAKEVTWLYGPAWSISELGGKEVEVVEQGCER